MIQSPVKPVDSFFLVLPLTSVDFGSNPIAEVMPFETAFPAFQEVLQLYRGFIPDFSGCLPDTDV